MTGSDLPKETGLDPIEAMLAEVSNKLKAQMRLPGYNDEFTENCQAHLVAALAALEARKSLYQELKIKEGRKAKESS